jgi:uncharacterized membrane protein YdjX (TVP38/TMEM64 family)
MTGRLRLLRERSAARFATLLLLLGLCGLAMLLAPEPDLARVRELIDRLGPLAPVAAVVAGAALLVALVPRTVITVAWGALFGPVGGAGYTLAAALLAAAVGFGIGRLLGRDFVHSHSGAASDAGGPNTLADRVRRRVARLDKWFARQSVFGVVTVRLVPIGGFGLVSYGYGITGARLRPYLLGSLLASIPSAFGYAAIGAAVASPGQVNWLATAPAGLGLVATTIIVTRWWRRRAPAPAGPDPIDG